MQQRETPLLEAVAVTIVIKKHPTLEKLQLAGGMKNATAAGANNMTK
jgi:hypothetical protein